MNNKTIETIDCPGLNLSELLYMYYTNIKLNYIWYIYSTKVLEYVDFHCDNLDFLLKNIYYILDGVLKTTDFVTNSNIDTIT